MTASLEYIAAHEVATQASRVFVAAKNEFRAGRISAEAYAEAFAIHEAAQRVFDVAIEAEQNRPVEEVAEEAAPDQSDLFA